MTHVRTLKMTEDVLSVKYSPNGRFLAVALLDSTVKVFYADTLKFFLSLYGHKVRAQMASAKEKQLRWLYSCLCLPWTFRATPSSS